MCKIKPMLDDSHYQTRLLGICGSTRKGSWNLALLRTAAALTADDVSLSIQNVGDLPHYDQDRDDTLGGTDTPGPVVDLRRSVSEADALIVASPELQTGRSLGCSRMRLTGAPGLHSRRYWLESPHS